MINNEGDKDNSFDSGAIELILENQQKELQLRTAELDVEKQRLAIQREENERAFLYAEKQLSAQERDRKEERVYRQSLESKSLWLLLIVTGMILTFLAFAVWKDKDQMIIELVKIIGYGGAGTVGGYAWGYNKKNTE